MTVWSNYTADRPSHTVTGELRILQNVESPQLGNSRDILVYLPPSYHHSDRHYPVLYMQDGQNLFDARTSFSGEWQVDETMQQLSIEHDLEAMVVGITNNQQRIHEYNPYQGHSRFGEARGDAYVHFMTDTLKPMIDADFRTRSDPANTGVLGSSMGGLISLYAYLACPHIFGLCAAMSPSLWIAMGAVFDHATHSANRHGRLYLDVGGHETRNKRYSGAVGDSVSNLYGHMKNTGYDADTLKFVRDPQGEHNEISWARRFPDAVRFLLNA
jgi:predicted alpha/beta superfamily hydrolase